MYEKVTISLPHLTYKTAPLCKGCTAGAIGLMQTHLKSSLTIYRCGRKAIMRGVFFTPKKPALPKAITQTLALRRI